MTKELKVTISTKAQAQALIDSGVDLHPSVIDSLVEEFGAERPIGTLKFTMEEIIFSPKNLQDLANSFVNSDELEDNTNPIEYLKEFGSAEALVSEGLFLDDAKFRAFWNDEEIFFEES